MERFKIFPSIGIARLGGSKTEFFVCPETENSLGTEFNAIGVEVEVQKFKDAQGLIKRQSARFKIFELDNATNEYLPLNIQNAEVNWSVQLVNKKAAIKRPANPPLDYATTLPLEPISNHPEKVTIDGGIKNIKGAKDSAVEFISGKYISPVNQAEHIVKLGELRTDANGNLIVLGGFGISKSPSDKPVGASYYNNADWYDDTSDGFVTATIKLPDGNSFDALGSWVIIAPPDFAPDVKGVVTLFDIMQQVAIEKGLLTKIQTPSFVADIKPLIERYGGLKWVNNLTSYNVSYDLNTLSDDSEAAKQKRKEVSGDIKDIEGLLAGHVSGLTYKLTEYQYYILDKWEKGEFVNDLGNLDPTINLGNQLTRNVLDTTVGQGFCPGIEGGVILKNPDIYSEAFRIDHTKVFPGDITGLMALPWQADFLKCSGNWWPTQRPDKVKLPDGTKKNWIRPIVTHQELINDFNKLGFVKPKQIAGDLEQIEEERGF